MSFLLPFNVKFVSQMIKGKNRVKKVKNPWPTKDAMEQIYDMKLWGGKEYDFYSGEGSHHPDLVKPYLKVVAQFIQSFTTPLTVCDLGCGDFNVGKELVPYTAKYIAVDIAEQLIERNKTKFSADNLEFQYLDLAEDDLPAGDCAIVRQVLQHLSNQEVHKVVTKLAKFKYVILTEHLPEGDFVSNKDIISGQGIRLRKQSGLRLTDTPFNFQVKQEKQLLSVVDDYKGKIVTTLYHVF